MIEVIQYNAEPTPEMWELLLLADPNQTAVEQYLAESILFVAENKGKLFGVAALRVNGDNAELENIAVAAGYQCKGLGKKLLREVIEQARNRDVKILTVGTGNSSVHQLGFYQQCGFRMSHIEKDYFADYQPPIFENDIACLDRVILIMFL